MSIVDFKTILKSFRGDDPTDAEKEELFKEVLLMTLARATSSDSNIQSVEVDAVRDCIKRETGEELSSAKIRVAANSEIFETTPLDKFLRRSAKKMETQDRVRVMQSLVNIISSDDRLSSSETDYFNMVAKNLDVDPTSLEKQPA